VVSETASSYPIFGVIISTYHRPASLYWSIRSVLEQTYSDLQLYVVGDCCTDETEEMVRELQRKDMRVHWKNLDINHGGGHTGWKTGDNGATAKNVGFEMSSEPFIAFNDDDNIWLSNHLQAHVNLLDNQDVPRADLQYSRGILYNKHDVKKVIGDSRPRENTIDTSAIVISRDMAMRVNGKTLKLWRSTRAVGSKAYDWDLVRRVIKLGGIVRHVPHVTYEVYQDHPQRYFGSWQKSESSRPHSTGPTP